jgi:hypothetical protein
VERGAAAAVGLVDRRPRIQQKFEAPHIAAAGDKNKRRFLAVRCRIRLGGEAGKAIGAVELARPMDGTPSPIISEFNIGTGFQKEINTVGGVVGDGCRENAVTRARIGDGGLKSKPLENEVRDLLRIGSRKTERGL